MQRNINRHWGCNILAKPVLTDFQELREGGILWGYPHCVQQFDHTQTAIERKQTLITFENMGFYFAKPTTFKNPMFKIGKVDYYAVIIHQVIFVKAPHGLFPLLLLYICRLL